MSTPDELIQQAREACEGVTEGPWEASTVNRRRSAWVRAANGRMVDHYIRPTDARFIAAARTLVPALADALETAQALAQSNREVADDYADEIEAAHADRDTWHERWRQLVRDYGAAVKERERVEAQLAGIRAERDHWRKEAVQARRNNK